MTCSGRKICNKTLGKSALMKGKNQRKENSLSHSRFLIEVGLFEGESGVGTAFKILKTPMTSDNEFFPHGFSQIIASQ